MTEMNRQILLNRRPEGMPVEEDFKLVETELPELKDGEFLAKTIYLSVDPYMRGRMNDRKSYSEPFKLDEVIGGGTVSRVVQSKNPKFKEGDITVGMLGWQEYAISDGKGVRNGVPKGIPMSACLGVLGMPGMTGYFGLLDIAEPKDGETVVVSGAAGAVGSLVGQIAKIKGCRVIGTAGSDEKVNHIVNDLGFDAGLNYKTSQNYYKDLKELCPDGIDVYFDNVGGPMTDAAIALINTHARISICGQIALYNSEKAEEGPRFLWKLIEKQAKIEGFLVFQFVKKYKQAYQDLTQWVKEGKIQYRENITEGIENTPKAFIGMFHGENTGKQIVKVSEE